MPLGIEHIAIQAAASGSLSIRKENAFGPGVHALYMREPFRAPVLAAVHLDADRYTPEDAREWLRKNGFDTGNLLASRTGKAKGYNPQTEIQAALSGGLRLMGAGEPVEIQAEVERDGRKLRPFRMVAYTGVAMRLEGYYRPVVVDLAGMKAASRAIPMLRDHDPAKIVAHAEEVEISERRVHAAGIMSGVGEAAQEVNALADNGFPWQSSIGASAEKMEYVEAGQSAKANGRNFDGPILIARASTLREISFVPLGADPGTSAKVSTK